MFGIRFIKVQPTTHVIQYVSGEVRRAGTGLAFFYYEPTTSLVAVPLASTDVPFIFNELTRDFQEVTIQGQVAYRISEPERIAALLNFTLDSTGRRYVSTDPEELPQRVINQVKVLTRKEVQNLSLREALRSSDQLVERVTAELRTAREIVSLGLDILGVSILAVKPTPETARALEAEARERLLREADEAIYSRRNAAVEQERSIKENELNTEVAVENKRRQIREAQMEAERVVQEKQHELQEAEMGSRISLEERNKTLVELTTGNARLEADARAYSVSEVVKAIGGTDARTLQALVSAGMKPDQLIAFAFQGLAERADKIGQLNVSPDLLHELLNKGGQTR